MFDHGAENGASTKPLRVLVVVAICLYVVGSLYLLIETRSRVGKLEQAHAESDARANQLASKLHTSQSQVEALGGQLGLTQEQLDRRASELRRQQQAAEARLSEQTSQAKQQTAEVRQEVAGVKTELGGTKTDLAATRTDLESTKAKLESTIGDLGRQSGLIARNSQDVEYLKHRGDRAYFEFTLRKKQRIPVSTVSFELKKTDAKKGKFTLNVLADDKTIEKKDRTIMEPMQFYTGKERQLYEVVIFKVDGNSVSGYLATPKQGLPAAQ
jgi:multidrug efflux pump subunit AcrA (membrane-fusion protein)